LAPSDRDGGEGSGDEGVDEEGNDGVGDVAARGVLAVKVGGPGIKIPGWGCLTAPAKSSCGDWA
jgi:hypothetical protein